MNDRNWVGCLYLEDVPAWALGSSEFVLGSSDPQGDAQNPFLVLQNGQVVGASSTPRRRGVELGMRKRKARTLCPEASAHPREPTLETAAWDQLLDALNQRTPRIESPRPGLAWFEPVRTSEDWGWLRDTPFQCGLGMRRPVARLAAGKAAPGRRLRIEETHEDRFLHRVPVDALTEIGFDDSLAEQLSLFGYPTVGAAQALSSHHLSVQFGDEGEHLAEFLEGGSGRISFYSPPPSVEHTRNFEDEVGEPGPLKAALEEASRDIADRVQGKQFQRVALHLEGRKQEGSSSRVLVEPRARADTLHRAATALLDQSLSAEMAVQTLTLSVGSLRAADQQQASLFYDRPERREAVSAMNRRHPGALLRVVRERSMSATHERKETGAGASLTSGPTPASDLRAWSIRSNLARHREATRRTHPSPTRERQPSSHPF